MVAEELLRRVQKLVPSHDSDCTVRTVQSQTRYPERVTRPSAYLDHAATTPMLPEAIEAMTVQLQQVGNASSLHGAGRRMRRVVEESRETIADALGARPSEVVFTSGGTEADNLAIKGFYWARRPRRRVLISSVEHHAALDPAQWLADSQGAAVELLEVDEHGRVRPETLRAAIARDPDDVAVVSVMWANNEVGTVQPVRELAAVAHEHGIPFHTDAVQAVGQLPVSFAESGVDALTLTGHKIGGPMGAGALLLARGQTPVSVQHGGGQERDVRSGTLDAPAIAGLAAAVSTAVKEQEALSRRLASLRDELIERVRAAVPDVVLNGDPGHASQQSASASGGRPEVSPGRLPGNAHFSFPGCEGDALLMLLDAKGVECSTGSACSAGVAQPSHVLLAMGADAAAARGSLRFTLGHTSTRDDVDRLIEVLPAAVERARRAGLG
ncbi:cysteine desulfurase [Nonomuraea longispora]|uniref:cysteine desulfurase n=1 Tax=Nonomuraea longispora TaxID=1848320 RepID=A0A4R4MML7_9ACTN|nr:cysteine desulfurase [Nonomuraea longispora]